MAIKTSVPISPGDLTPFHFFRDTAIGLGTVTAVPAPGAGKALVVTHIVVSGPTAAITVRLRSGSTDVLPITPPINSVAHLPDINLQLNEDEALVLTSNSALLVAPLAIFGYEVSL